MYDYFLIESKKKKKSSEEFFIKYFLWLMSFGKIEVKYYIDYI